MGAFLARGLIIDRRYGFEYTLMATSVHELSTITIITHGRCTVYFSKISFAADASVDSCNAATTYSNMAMGLGFKRLVGERVRVCMACVIREIATAID